MNTQESLRSRENQNTIPRTASQRIGQVVRNQEAKQAAARRASQRLGEAAQTGYKANQTKATSPERAKAPVPVLRVMRIKDFDREAYRETYPKAELNADEAYAKRTREYLGRKRQFLPEGERLAQERAKAAAEKFERFCLYGIQSNAWLGNLRDKDGNLPFKTVSAMATEFDDYRHRIDMFSSLIFPKPPVEPGGKPRSSRLTIGFDATTGGGRKDILGKLTRFQNDPKAELPFGFSQIKYGVKANAPAKIDLVPRYTIGVTMPEVAGLEEMASYTRTPDRKILDVKFNAAQSMTTRFIMLSEMRAQNELYLAMLPDQLDTPQLTTAKRRLDKMEEVLETALDQCGEFLVKHNLNFARYKNLDLSYERSPDERASLCELVEGILIEKSHRDYTERVEERAQRGERRATDGTDRDGTYAQIMNCCRELTAAARAGRLDEYRKVGAHNEAIDKL